MGLYDHLVSQTIKENERGIDKLALKTIESEENKRRRLYNDSIYSAIRAQDTPPVITGGVSRKFLTEPHAVISGAFTGIDRDGLPVTKWATMYPPKIGTFTLNVRTGVWTYVCPRTYEKVITIGIAAVDSYSLCKIGGIQIEVRPKLPLAKVATQKCEPSGDIFFRLDTMELLHDTTYVLSISRSPRIGEVEILDDDMIHYRHIRSDGKIDSFELSVIDSRGHVSRCDINVIIERKT